MGVCVCVLERKEKCAFRFVGKLKKSPVALMHGGAKMSLPPVSTNAK